MSDPASAIIAALQAVDDGQSLDEAFIWEPPIGRRPLVTFGDLRRLAHSQDDASARPTHPREDEKP